VQTKYAPTRFATPSSSIPKTLVMLPIRLLTRPLLMLKNLKSKARIFVVLMILFGIGYCNINQVIEREAEQRRYAQQVAAQKEREAHEAKERADKAEENARLITAQKEKEVQEAKERADKAEREKLAEEEERKRIAAESKEALRLEHEAKKQAEDLRQAQEAEKQAQESKIEAERERLAKEAEIERLAQKPKYQLRRTPIAIISNEEFSDEEFKEIYSKFKLDRDSRPIEYVKNDFRDNRDKTITDHATGLMWQKSGSSSYIGYEEATAYIKKLNSNKFAGYSDWRLPTVDELKSLLTPKAMNGDLYINPLFGKMQKCCWTSDNRANGASKRSIGLNVKYIAWCVDFDIGNVSYYNNYGSSYVRAVRSLK